MIDFGAFQSVVEKNIELEIQKRLPDMDSSLLRVLYRFLRGFYAAFPPEQIENTFIVLISDNLPNDLLEGTPKTQNHGVLEDLIKFPAVIQWSEDGAFRLWNKTVLPQQALQASGMLAYVLDDLEHIWVNGYCVRVPCFVPHTKSAFATPTFFHLEDTLKAYYQMHAKTSIGMELSVCWMDNNRLRWWAAPESNLRDSLWLFIRDTLRGKGEVKREQNVDNSNPVDIKVTWNYSRARALIEIKWLGSSFDNAGKCTAHYTEFRAKRGAVQLRNYLLKSLEENPEHVFVGYLVVFDGRRKKTKQLLGVITWDDAWAYKDADIVYPRVLQDDKRLRLNNRFFINPNIDQIL